MANTLTTLVPSVVTSIRDALRTRVGFVRAANKNFDTKSARKDDTVSVPSPAPITPRARSNGWYPTSATAITSGGRNLTLSYDYEAAFDLTGDDILGMADQGSAFISQQVRAAAQGLANYIDGVIAANAVLNAGSAVTYGSGSATFDGTSKLEAASYASDALDAHGANPDRFLVLGQANIRRFTSLSDIYNVDKAGSDMTLRRGEYGEIYNAQVMRSNNGNVSHTAGTGQNWVTQGAVAVGGKTVVVDGGSGTFVSAGDIISFATDSINKYVVLTATAGTGDYTLTLGAGLVNAVADGVGVTIAKRASTSTRDIMTDDVGIILASRPFALPLGPDGQRGDAGEHAVFADPVSGMAFRLSYYKGVGQAQYSLNTVFGVLVPQPERVCVIYN